MDLINYIKTSPYVRTRASTRYPELSVVKYAKQVFYKNLWNRELEECRGLVIDADFNIVSYPFTKIYNYGIEKRAPNFSEMELLKVYKKINGFMAAITWYNGDILVSTTGSLDSDFVQYVYDMIPDLEAMREVCKHYPNTTFMFECVHASDPHIIEEELGLYLLGSREKRIGSLIEAPRLSIAEKMGVFYVPEQHMYLQDVKAFAKSCKHEGFVMYNEKGISAKIKSPYYLTKKFVARCTNEVKLSSPTIKEKLDEEYYGLIDKIQEDVGSFMAMDEQKRLEWVRNYFNNSLQT